MNKTTKITICLSVLLACAGGGVAAQAQSYTVNGNAHSHNDYLRERPFHEAYDNGFGSMEIDLYLENGELLVAHMPRELTPERNIAALYIEPLLEKIAQNGGKIRPDGGRLQFLIDLKTGGETLRALGDALKPIRHLFDTENNPDAVRLVISGNGPAPGRFADYDTIFFFDGRPATEYNDEQLKRVAFYSAPFSSFSRWRGEGDLPAEDAAKIGEWVSGIHALGKRARFWGCPDTPSAWQTFIDLGVDYLNTDRPAALARFLGGGM